MRMYMPAGMLSEWGCDIHDDDDDALAAMSAQCSHLVRNRGGSWPWPQQEQQQQEEGQLQTPPHDLVAAAISTITTTTATTTSSSSSSSSSSVSIGVDLKSQVPLPHGWEQFLHLQTGQVYYVDWKSCRRSYLDPRSSNTRPVACASSEEKQWHHCSTSSSSSSEIIALDDEERQRIALTTPLLAEDWQLMQSRGWACSASRDEETCSSSVFEEEEVKDGGATGSVGKKRIRSSTSCCER